MLMKILPVVGTEDVVMVVIVDLVDVPVEPGKKMASLKSLHLDFIEN